MKGRIARPDPGGAARAPGASGLVTPAAVVAEVRRWIGTPYRHQASTRGAGTDCLGLVRGVWRALFGDEPERPPPYSPDWDEVARREILLAAARRHLRERGGPPRPGEVILFRMRRDAVVKHMGIVSGPAHFIHAYTGHGVVESALSEPWRRRIAGVFGFPGLREDAGGRDSRASRD